MLVSLFYLILSEADEATPGDNVEGALTKFFFHADVVNAHTVFKLSWHCFRACL